MVKDLIMNYFKEKQFSESEIQAVWEKGKIASGYDSRYVRLDWCDTPIIRNDYGNCEARWGWEIDHIIPKSQNGTDNFSNLQPLHWKNNRAKGDSRLKICANA